MISDTTNIVDVKKSMLTPESSVLHSQTEEGFQLHNPINIHSDQELAEAGYPGEGTKESPYIIEEFKINSDETCISIEETRKHLIIRNCILVSENEIDITPIINFVDVENVNILNCTFKGKLVYLEITRSMNGAIENSSMLGETNSIQIHHSSVYTISNNFYPETSAGIINLYDSDNIEIRDHYENGPTYISGSDSSYCTIRNNILFKKDV